MAWVVASLVISVLILGAVVGAMAYELTKLQHAFNNAGLLVQNWQRACNALERQVNEAFARIEVVRDRLGILPDGTFTRMKGDEGPAK